MITYEIKLPLPIGADPKKLSELGLCKYCGVILPLSGGGNAKNEALIVQFSKAMKFEATLLKKCELKFTDGAVAFEKIAKTFLSNKKVLQVSLFEVNALQCLEYRLSLEQLIALANQYEILKCLNEPACIWQVPKLSGNGMRVICSFGLVARAAQRMVVKLLRMAYQPQDFQYTQLGSAEKVQLAVCHIKQKGYTHALEIDIRDFFPSFTEEALIAALPLPREAVRHIVLAKSADWHPHPGYTHQPYILSPLGIPQGSASSAAVAHWCIARMQMQMEKLEDSDVINHVDNFYSFANSQQQTENVSKALSSGIDGLLGGDFIEKIEQAGEVAQGFRMLGCWITVDKSGETQVEPTDTNWNKLDSRVETLKKRVNSKLTSAEFEEAAALRIDGLQDFLRLESICQGWLNAFKFCGPHMKDVENDLTIDLDLIRYTYNITQEELKPLKDPSTAVTIKWYSGI